MTETDIIAFTRGIPAPETFPAEQLAACAQEVLLGEGRQVLQYGQAAGYKLLRDIIAKQYGVEIERVLLGQGSLQLFDHIIRLMVKPGDLVLVEQPTYDRSLTLLRRSGAKLIGIDLAVNGISLEQLESVLDSGSQPILFYTIPDFQNPTGRVMSLEKRRGLLRLADQYGFLVVEDAPYRRLRYNGDELPSLFDLDSQNVLQLSSFSKLISPGLRVGYAILPVNIAEKVIRFAEDTYINPPFFNQALVQHYIQHGWLEPHLKTIQELYSQRLSALLAALQENMQGKGSWTKPDGGFFLGFYPKKKMEVDLLLQKANQAGVKLSDGRGFFVQGGDDFIRLPFCALTPQEIRTGIQRLAGLL
jgi:2-aminoadipate transaminase